MTTETKKDNRAEQQARSQLEGIVEMVQNLDPEKAREKAAHEYAKNLSRQRCEEILRDECSIYCRSDDSFDELREAVAVNIADKICEPDGFDFDEDSARDEARDRIMEDPLSVQVRSGWRDPGVEMDPEEFNILLCTGGPAVRITGDLDLLNQPDTARLEYQDWFEPWEPLYDITAEEQQALLTYCQQFYLGD